MRAVKRKAPQGKLRRTKQTQRRSVSGPRGGNSGNQGPRGGGRGRGGRGRGGRGQHQHQGRGRGQGRGGFGGRGGGGEHRGLPHTVGPRLSEADVGITEFISHHEGFSAVMKHRYSDFQVNEIDSEGNVVKLTSMDTPAEEDETAASRHELIPEEIWDKLENMVKKYKADREPRKWDMTDSSKPDMGSIDKQTEASANKNLSASLENVPRDEDESLDPPSVEKSSQIKPEPQSDEPRSQSNCGASNSPAVKEHRPCVELDVTALDKDSRRAIHNCVKSAFKEINSNTKDVDGKKLIVFSVGKGGDRGHSRGKWPSSRNGEYLYFVVHKRNMDTSETVNLLAQNLWMKPSAITFAGTKDKRGTTSQLMSIRRGEPHRLFKISRFMGGVYLGNYCFKEKPLRLGDLKGNQFKIALRHVEGSEEQINAGLESLKKHGFINYYGLQRFGTNKAVPTHSIGKSLLLGDWQKAIDLILEPRDGNAHIKPALDEWKSSKNAQAALEKLNGQSSCLEVLLLKGLMRYGPKDFVNALTMIPLNTRLMYLHSYQSLIWNKGVSFRLREFGLEPVVGDLVIVKSEKNTNEDSNSSSEDTAPVDSEVVVAEGATRQEVKCLTEDDIKNYKIKDIVLPLPGYEVVYPNNSVANFMKDLLKEDGITSESMCQQVRQYSVRGTYRPLIATVDKLSWKFVHYNDDATDFIASDLDEMMKGKEIATDIPDGKYKALIFTMCLEPSTYATMAIREITRKDTSAVIQVSISAAATAHSGNEGTVISTGEEHESDLKEEQVSHLREENSIDVKEEQHSDAKEDKVCSLQEENSNKDDILTLNETDNCLKRKGEELSDEILPEKRPKD